MITMSSEGGSSGVVPAARRHAPFLLAMLAMLTWMIVVGYMIVQRHNKFLTFDFDMGIHDQSLWLMSQGKWWNTVCGLPVFGHHAMFMYYLLVPFVWLGAGPNMWNLLQVAAVGLSAIPIFLLAQRKLRSEWLALAFAVAWLLSPTSAWLVQETFHPETMAIPFFLTGYLFAVSRPEGSPDEVRRHNIWTIAWLAMAVLWKEDIAIAVMLMGLGFMFRGRRQFGKIVFIGAAAYFAVVGIWMVPTLAGDTSAYGMLYGQFGETPFDVVKSSLRHPTWFWERLDTNNALSYANRIQGPWAWAGLLSPITLMMAVPQFFINIMTNASFTFEIRYHYQVIPLAVSAIAAIEGVAWAMKRWRDLAHVLVGAILVVSLMTASSWGPLPFSSRYRPVEWGMVDVQTAGWEAALDRIGDDTSGVTAHYPLVPHVTHRQYIYSFPNPWIRANYLTLDRAERRPEVVQWLVVSEAMLLNDPRGHQLVEDLLASGEFGDAETVAGVTSYRRLKPPTGMVPLSN